MFEITVKHRNPSRDAEYCKEHRADGYILIAFSSNADGTLLPGLFAEARFPRDGAAGTAP